MKKLTLLSAILVATSAFAGSRPNYDELLARPRTKKAATADPRVLHRDDRLGVPSFVRVPKAAPTAPSSARAVAPYARLTPSAAALSQLQALSQIYGGRSPSGEIVAPTVRKPNRPAVVNLRQQVGGIDVFHGAVGLLLDRDNNLTAVSGHLVDGKQGVPAYRRGGADAIAAAYADLTGKRLDAGLLAPVAGPAGKYTHYQLVPYARPLPVSLRGPARVKPVIYELPEGLLAAHYVEVHAGSDSYAYVIADADGRVLFRKDLTNDATAFTYQTWADATAPYQPFQGPAGNVLDPHPTGLPDGWTPPLVQPNLITLISAPFSKGDPWLPDNATASTGNNVDAYADLYAPDGFSPGDVRAQTTGPASFVHGYDFGLLPYETNDQIQAAVGHLFYMTNWLHDWYYDSGFTEADGNAQEDNYGRGGVGGDSMHAEAQDYSGVDNANMMTPGDGAHPRMQMYLFVGSVDSSLTVTIPPAPAAAYQFAGAVFGPRTFEATALVAAAAPNDGCSSIAGNVAGLIALVDRGNCSFQQKAVNAQAAGAVGVLIVDSSTDTKFPPSMGGDPAQPPVSIPAMLLHYGDGVSIRNSLGAGVTAQMHQRPAGDVDGTIDNQIVSHEYGHYINNRLVHDATGLANWQARGLQEGWADFHALLMTVRAEDGANNWSGAYPLAGYASQVLTDNAYYFGIRRVPYSVDYAKDPLTFRDIGNGQALPAGVAYAFGEDGASNSEFHNTGEVWASMLFECYVALLRDSGRLTFAEAQSRMKAYVLAGYKMTPAAPDFVDARDAFLAAAFAGDPADFQLFAAAFARRGLGMGAVAPDRDSPTQTGVIESYANGPDVDFVSATLTDDIRSCDNDGYLDTGETGTLRLTLRSTGTAALTATTATVTADSPAVTFANGGVAAFPTIALFDSATVEIPVTLGAIAPQSIVHFTISYRDANGIAAGDKQATFHVKVQTDEFPNTTATETVDSADPLWAMTAAVGQTTFGIDESAPPKRAFFGPDPSTPADFSLVTPPLHVDGGDFSFSFRHKFSFENDSGNYYDGAVVELSEDGGTTWTDLGSRMVSGGYNVTLATSDGTNPINGRPAFGGTSFAFSIGQMMTTRVDLGTAWAGKTVQVRFRIGADSGGSAYGWMIDDVAFTGLAALPFTSVSDEQGDCPSGVVRASAGANQTVHETDRVTLNGSGSALSGNALVYRWQQVAGPMVALSDSFAAMPSFTAPAVALDTTLSFRLTVSDGVLTDKAVTQVLVGHVNRAPVALAGPGQTVDEGSTVTLRGAGSDPDGDALRSYSWSQVGGPQVSLATADASDVRFTAPAVSSGTVQLAFDLVVSDGQLSSAPSQAVVAVRHLPRPPTLTAGANQSVKAGATVVLPATAVDPEQGTLTYQWTQTSGAPVVLMAADTAAARFSAPQVTTSATLTFSVKATSTSGQSAQASVSVEVAPVAAAAASGGCSSTGSGSLVPFALLLAVWFRRRRRTGGGAVGRWATR